jgi:hypothetical protein
MLVLRPPGRGAWTPVLLQVSQGRHSPSALDVKKGQRVEIAGRVYRVAEVRP